LACRDQQIEAISTKLLVDKSDLKTYFPKYARFGSSAIQIDKTTMFPVFLTRWHWSCRAWCDQHGEGVITAAKKEFKEHVEEMEKRDMTGDEGWATFEDIDHDDFNPRAFAKHQSGSAVNGKKVNESLTGSFMNPFYDEKNPFLNPNLN
jgi:hypothetical protein